MENTSLKVTSFIFAIVLSFMLIVSPGFCDTLKKVAVCPLEMNTTEDLSFLQKGLFSMLSSRLADPGKVEILERETIDKLLDTAQSSPATKGALNESKARIIGAGIGVDYVLFGSMTLFGKSVSLDMAMVDIKTDAPTLTFSRQAQEPGAVITEMDQIAAQINLKTFNRKPEQIIPKEQYEYRPEMVPQGDGYASPLTNYRNLYAANGTIIGMALADVDGDRKNEVVIVYDHAIEILKDNLDGKLKPVKRIKDDYYMDIIGIDAADINGNGTAEIFVTRVHPESGFVKSLVFEFNGSDYRTIIEDLPWYLRVVKDTNGKDTLYGQKMGKQGPYSGRNVFKVEVQNKTYVPGAKIMVPEGFTVMSLAMGSLMGENQTSALFTDKKGRLTLLNETGRVEWSSEEGFGGTRRYYAFVGGKDKYLSEEKDGSQGKGTYFQPRNLVFDLNRDGKKEVFVIKNVDTAGNMFQKVRKFKNGSIEILNWNEMGLSPDRAPKKIPGQITDIVIGDYDNNSKNKLLVSIIKKRNNFSEDKSKSLIIAYDME